MSNRQDSIFVVEQLIRDNEYETNRLACRIKALEKELETIKTTYSNAFKFENDTVTSTTILTLNVPASVTGFKTLTPIPTYNDVEGSAADPITVNTDTAQLTGKITFITTP